MASAKFNVERDEVTLKLTTSEALYVAAELGGGNSHFHGVDHFVNGKTPYSALSDALDLGMSGPSLRHRNKFGLRKKYRGHVTVTRVTRPTYDASAGDKIAKQLGFIEAT